MLAPPPLTFAGSLSGFSRGTSLQNFSAKGNEGKLVRDILDTKDELSKGQAEQEEKADPKETGILLGRGRKKKEEGGGYKKEE
eukprot:9466612-Pyramimonas_sp.AAC.2